MVNLELQDRQNIIIMLQNQPALQNEKNRRAVLEMAGLQKVIPQIDLEGSQFQVVTEIVSFLANYGRISYENEGLGLFLNAIRLQVGIEQQKMIDSLVQKYEMTEPMAPAPVLRDWKTANTNETVLEKIFGENTLRPVAFLEKGLEVSRSVALVQVKSGGNAWSGTGFMITPNLAMTNQHVVENADQLTGVKLRFNYQQDAAGHDLDTEDYVARPDGVFFADKELDFALFEVQGEPGKDWGCLPLKSTNVATGERVNIIQHPGGQPKQISIQNNLVEYVGGSVMQYVTSTMPGSSGSPVLNDNWDVVGLHHAGGNLPEPTTGRYYNRNECIIISNILLCIPANVRGLVDAGA